jgi:hypothetical protein
VVPAPTAVLSAVEHGGLGQAEGAFVRQAGSLNAALAPAPAARKLSLEQPWNGENEGGLAGWLAGWKVQGAQENGSRPQRELLLAVEKWQVERPNIPPHAVSGWLLQQVWGGGC